VAGLLADGSNLMLKKHFRISIILFGALTLIAGIAYPFLVTGIAQVLFPFQANGSIIVSNGQPVGSALIGQSFTNPKYFFGRPSASSPSYNAGASAGSNLGPLNPSYLRSVRDRMQELQLADSGSRAPVPVDLVTASGSGLDPHISVAAALYQVPRVARLRGVPEDSIRALVNAHRLGRQMGFLGEERVNVLRLNLALDGVRTGPEDR
jgi:potassium-transporting ATPase KdpC subunit